MNLDVGNWKSFLIGRFFTILNGKGITQEEISDNEGKMAAVQSGEENNGVMGYIDLNYCKNMDYTYTEKPCLTVARSGSAGFVSFQKDGCVVGDSAKILLLPDDVASIEVYLFMQSILSAIRFKYSYGRKVTEEKYLNDLIDLPIKRNSDGTPLIDSSHKYSDHGFIPDWQFMEKYVKSLHHKPLTTKNKPHQVPELKPVEWKRFFLGRLFEIKKGKRLTAEDQEEGNNLYIGAIDSNNGIANHIGQKPIHKGNTISLSYNGSVGEAFYQPDPYWATDDVNALYSKYDGFNECIGLFIATVIRQEKYRFSYGRKWTLENMKITDICLPVQHNSDGTFLIDKTHKFSDDGFVPDWQFMENYIKALPYGDRLSNFRN